MSHPDLIIAVRQLRRPHRGDILHLVKQIRHTATLDEAVNLLIAFLQERHV